jgi:hypothetical protein
MSLQIFVIFHKELFAETFEKVPQHLRKYLTFVAVNPEIPKSYPEGISVLNEWELPIYEPRYQKEKYNENSVIFHLYLNGILEKYEYVGFCQYDMYLDDFSNVIENLKPNTFIRHSILDTDSSYTFCFLETWNQVKTLRFLEYSIQEAFPEHDLKQEGHYPLFNTYIVPTKTFQTIVKWGLEIESELVKTGSPAGTYERFFAFVIGELLEPSDCVWNITHSEKLKALTY